MLSCFANVFFLCNRCEMPIAKSKYKTRTWFANHTKMKLSMLGGRYASLGEYLTPSQYSFNSSILK